MIMFKVLYNGKEYDVPVYHRYDLDKERGITTWEDCTKQDVGKYIMFDDGSELYTIVHGCNHSVVRTEAGSFRREDIRHLCVPKYKYSNYSGTISKDEHPLVRGYTKGEKALATRLAGGEKVKFISNRVKMLCLDNIRNEINQLTGGDKEATEKHIAKTIVRVSMGNGMPALKACEMIAIANDTNLTDAPMKKEIGNKPLFEQIGSAPEKPKMSDITALTKIGKAEEKKEASIAEVVSEEIG